MLGGELLHELDCDDPLANLFYAALTGKFHLRLPLVLEGQRFSLQAAVVALRVLMEQLAAGGLLSESPMGVLSFLTWIDAIALVLTDLFGGSLFLDFYNKFRN